MTDEVEELLRVLGPFYELIEEKKKILHVSDLSTGEAFFPTSFASSCLFFFLFVMSHNTDLNFFLSFYNFASCSTLSPFDNVC